MTLSLRERRRRETAREIQRAALKLAVRHGLDQVTTEAIAKDAGISTRTFFNYYANKEAAVVGHPPGYSDEVLAQLRTGTAPLADDLKNALDSHIASLAADIEVLDMVRQMVRLHPPVRMVLQQFVSVESAQLAEALLPRTQDKNVADALAESAVRCSARAIYLWETEKASSLTQALDLAWQSQRAASRILAD